MNPGIDLAELPAHLMKLFRIKIFSQAMASLSPSVDFWYFTDAFEIDLSTLIMSMPSAASGI